MHIFSLLPIGLRLCVLAFVLFAAAERAYSAKPASLLAGFSRGDTIIETSGSLCVHIDLYFARTGDQHSQGLMFIRELDSFEGMLFLYRRPAKITMWMKNTYIPLDMVFITEDGRVAGIQKNTTPFSTERIAAPASVTGVLEVNGGFTEKWQISTGDKLLLVN